MTRDVPAQDWPRHGGQPRALLERLGLPPGREVLDFSANLNPLGPPEWLDEHLPSLWHGIDRYPDPDYYTARCAIAEAQGLDASQVLLTNGGAEAIFLAAALHAGRQAAIVQPTFDEYARACRHYGLAIHSAFLAADFSLDERRACEVMREADVMFLCRPNNPSGTLIPRALIERLLEAGRTHGTCLVVDEAFIDFVEDAAESLIPLLAVYPNLLILRSLTKLYTIPGLRLGYLLGAPDIVARAAELQMPWSVNAPAAALVAPLLADEAFVARTHDWLRRELDRLTPALTRLGFEVSPTRVNFYLLRDRHQPHSTDALLRFLASVGILARHTHNFPGLEDGWLRLAVRSVEDNDRLLAVLSTWRQTRKKGQGTS
ncbi:threonine-phosphate decarboxylase CobD [Halomonas sp. McH1-25]|uniref:threonine-phosphate decarboxylase CobD n=1 Tax=unclassified Halomonas TaxID=2609666 RepID=UPI001EF5ECF8|nr:MULTISPECIES: threonine-phosphate decarboxylase CobD [unclassified Halomonas]MCG7599886.1 threonine-phosphate decarboxylase CobD [Halomonas sp. McH1-25]MCP1344388.1 threonine-phosphate decarboxylase CobD [Halomonas sp. FL8]MCP1362880.1 threonine-phosphate decarboxylase CobD [Halomonas sp. BBD45]